MCRARDPCEEGTAPESLASCPRWGARDDRLPSPPSNGLARAHSGLPQITGPVYIGGIEPGAASTRHFINRREAPGRGSSINRLCWGYGTEAALREPSRPPRGHSCPPSTLPPCGLRACGPGVLSPAPEPDRSPCSCRSEPQRLGNLGLSLECLLWTVAMAKCPRFVPHSPGVSWSRWGVCRRKPDSFTCSPAFTSHPCP